MRARVALVVGASKGIGAATAEAFAVAGAAVVLAARYTAALNAVAEGIETRGGRALAVGTDVTDAGAMRHLVEQTMAAALDYADQGIRVNVVAPGPIRTYHIEVAGEQAMRAAAMSTPMRRMGTAAEVAQAVLWLCSDQSSFVTGTVMPIDGGQAAGNKP